jgi:hypothetical protein
LAINLNWKCFRASPFNNIVSKQAINSSVRKMMPCKL